MCLYKVGPYQLQTELQPLISNVITPVTHLCTGVIALTSRGHLISIMGKLSSNTCNTYVTNSLTCQIPKVWGDGTHSTSILKLPPICIYVMVVIITWYRVSNVIGFLKTELEVFVKHRCTCSVFCVLTYSHNALGSNGNYHNSHAFYDCDVLQPNLKLTIGNTWLQIAQNQEVEHCPTILPKGSIGHDTFTYIQ